MADPNFSELAASFSKLAEAMTASQQRGDVAAGGKLVTVGAGGDKDLERKIYCRDCLDVRFSAGPNEPPQGGSAWGPHSTYINGVRTVIEHPRKPKLLTYDHTAVTEGLLKGTHGKQCIQCGSPLLQEVR